MARSRENGYATLVDPDRNGGRAMEASTVSCCHCQAVVFLHDLATGKRNESDIGGFCFRCMKPTCGPCADRGVCDPFEKQIERAEARGRMLAAIGV
jgi:hypothetical protein